MYWTAGLPEESGYFWLKHQQIKDGAEQAGVVEWIGGIYYLPGDPTGHRPDLLNFKFWHAAIPMPADEGKWLDYLKNGLRGRYCTFGDIYFAKCEHLQKEIKRLEEEAEKNKV